ncbi:MAG: class I SAM-dependent methyltransferase [Phycisphaerae bacterium]|nr:class I SAM-dependent methyltransferase [Phycisphaerae bacterium]
MYRRLVRACGLFSSERYWIDRYEGGGDSGSGSYGRLAEFKAEILNDFVRENRIETVIEYGCGDGNQLALADYPRYTGYDVSPRAVAMCQSLFAEDPTKTFHLVSEYDGQTADLTLSLDVVFHLVEDTVFDGYMRRLFDSSAAHVIIYSSNTDTNDAGQSPHVRNRRFTDWVDINKTEWTLLRHIPNRYPFTGDGTKESIADFYIYKRMG